MWEHYEADTNTDMSNSLLSADGNFLSFAVPGINAIGIRNLRRGRSTFAKIPASCGLSSSVPAPDTSRIAYACQDSKGEQTLRIVTSGRDDREVYRKPTGRLTLLQATDDGSQVLVMWRSPQETEVALIDVSTGSKTVLLSEHSPSGSNAGVLTGPLSLSRDGKLLAVVRLITSENVPSRRFLVRNLESQAELPVPAPSQNCSLGGWTRGNDLVYVCTSGTVSEVRRWRHDAVGNETTQTISEAVRPLGVTQDGTLIYFTQGSTVNTYEAGLDPVTAKVTTQPIRLNTGDEGKSMYPVWFDGGKMISYVSFPGTGLLMRPYPQGTERRIVPDLPGIGGTAWMPDGTVIVAGFKRGLGQGYYRLNTESGKTEPILLQSQETGELRGFPDLSHDGTLLFYRDDQHHEIRVRNLKDSQERVLYRATAPYPLIRSLHLSPDGQRLAFLINSNAVADVYGQRSVSTNELMIVPTSGGPARQLYSAKWPETILPVQSFAWMQDSKQVLFVKGRGQKLGLWSLSISGGQPKSTRLAIEGMRHLAVHPNGSKIAFAAGNEGTIHVRSLNLR